MADFDLSATGLDASTLESNFETLSTITIEEIIFALIVLVVGYVVVKIIINRIEHYFSKSTKMPKLMAINIVKAIKLFLYIIVILCALQALGIEVSVFIISIFAFISIIMSFGMKDTINNLASGVWIAASRAYDIDDEVELSGKHGTVMDMNVMATEIKQLDNTRIIIPNGTVWNSPIINVTRMDRRMIAVEYGVAYNTVIQDAIDVALKVADEHPKLHKEPKPIVRFREMADSAVVLQLRVWVDTDDYYQAKSDVLTGIYNGLNKAGIGIPFPQVDVHMKDD
ncbi:MscS Mechanosensitive ion channel [Methanolacinia petrolearia DSM 11571]|uniref:MscS Mechanosensitive ion channel n=1 Tax=Methanolacinia petrolearia (strain DSM 11571 / OCM 486 / SEBR 4847) TaxID=679926 RepID=E1RHL3_METP4|nr:mechanosensitive ion channel family protein [Methanolacinia petrolearia]ADN35322.1 MscS Mechanosensitive ion channel [Methanolacinia petrolearia DSM 11571]